MILRHSPLLRCAVLISLAVSLAAPAIAQAQAFPSRPLRMIVPYAPGGALDIFARLAAQKMSESLGQNVLVENRPGANGTIGTAAVARMAPDGYAFMATSTVHYMIPFFSKNVPYDALRDFTPIISGGNVPNVLAIHPALPVNSITELIEYGKKNRGKLYYGTTGVGSSQHLGGILLAQMAGIDLEHVPYKGGNPTVNDAVAGQIPIAILTSATIMPHVRSGKLRALALLEGKRSRDVPGVPTINEVLPGYAVPELWFGAIGPAGMPRPIVERLNAEFGGALRAPDVRARLEALGFEVTGNNSPDQFAATINSDVEIIRKIVTAAGIKPE